MKYNVIAIDEYGDENLINPGLTKSQAKETARETASKTESQVYVEWTRASDNQHGYLNSDGNHSITGKPWPSKKISAAASALGKMGGSKTSDAKKKSSAENGKKGGRPRNEKDW